MRVELSGTIASAGFRSGDRFVTGIWHRSPVGAFTDVMWATPDGRRILIAPDDRTARFVTSIYPFDEVRIQPIAATARDRAVTVVCAALSLQLDGGRPRRLPPRPAAATRFIEAPVARRLMGVDTYGVSPTGVREWYRATAWSWVGGGAARLEGRSLGPPGPIDPPTRFGFSEPPRRPSIVRVRPLLDFPAGTTLPW